MTTKKPVALFMRVSVAAMLLMMVFSIGRIEAASTEKTLDIGLVTTFQNVVGLDMKREIEALVPVFNQQGRLVIKGEKYRMNLIAYDSNLNNETGRAAVEKLIANKVKFILGDDTVSGWVQLTESNKVLVICHGSNPVIIDPKNKLTFQATFINTGSPVAWGWLSGNDPQVKTVAGLYPDWVIGHLEADKLKKFAQTFGQKLLDESFFPMDQTDLSALASKITRLNPDVFTTGGMGTNQLAAVYKAMRDAGYKGKFWHTLTASPEQLMKVMSPEQAEGMYTTIEPSFLPSPPPVAKEFKDIFMAKYNSWDPPNIFGINTFYALMAGLQKAQSTDPEKVAAALAGGLEFDSPSGRAQMISRPDVKNTRTVDAVYTTYVARINNGKANVIATLTPSQGGDYLKKIFGW